MNPMLALFNLGGGEIILILAIVLILFGAKKLPELAKGLGQGIKEFKKATHNVSEGVVPASTLLTGRTVARAAEFRRGLARGDVAANLSSLTSQT
jgi:sec-independent protein translocase protein TatA